jgi:hypothetical protein
VEGEIRRRVALVGDEAVQEISTRPKVRFSDIAGEELVQLKENIALRQWLQLHPTDSMVPHDYADEETDNEDWGVGTDKHFLLSSGKVVVRREFFYGTLENRPETLRSDL